MLIFRRIYHLFTKLSRIYNVMYIIMNALLLKFYNNYIHNLFLKSSVHAE
jgi:hypothetical protein